VRLLRCVDEQEEKRERARSHGTLFYRQTLDFLQEIFERWRAFLCVSPGSCRNAKLLDDLEGFLPLESLNDTTESGG
jgi:hypothetical protein